MSDNVCVTEGNKEEKQLQAMIYAIEHYPEINRTKLMKYIFFIDLFAYNKTDDTLLEDCYIRLPNGPVPKFGFEYTRQDFMLNAISKKLFEIERNPTVNGYYYQFKLKEGVHADLSKFSEGEIDLLALTLETVKSRKTAYLSDLSHTYDLWKSYENGYIINLSDFRLNPDDLEHLELILNTKKYLNTLNQDKDNLKKEGISFPFRLPMYFNANTKEPIKQDKE